jgi:hypothetical protein
MVGIVYLSDAPEPLTPLPAKIKWLPLPLLAAQKSVRTELCRKIQAFPQSTTNIFVVNLAVLNNGFDRTSKIAVAN